MSSAWVSTTPRKLGISKYTHAVSDVRASRMAPRSSSPVAGSNGIVAISTHGRQ